MMDVDVEIVMWYAMESAQNVYDLSDRLIRAISGWNVYPAVCEDDVEELINQGADVNRLHGTFLPLHCACMVSDVDCIALLLRRGARVNNHDGYFRTALHYAAERNILSVEILLQHGADINAGDGNQDTPLHWAAFKNNVDCVKGLLQHGAKVDAKDFNNDTPLLWAARKGNLNVINILLNYNASVNIRNLKGETPISRAATLLAIGLNTDDDDACLELLLKASGQFELRDQNGRVRNEIARDNKLCEMILPMCKNVRTLQDLCRHSVRYHLGYRYLPNVVPKLPIPVRLKDFILLNS